MRQKIKKWREKLSRFSREINLIKHHFSIEFGESYELSVQGEIYGRFHPSCKELRFMKDYILHGSFQFSQLNSNYTY